MSGGTDSAALRSIWPPLRPLVRARERLGGRLLPLALLALLLVLGALGYGGVGRWCEARGVVAWSPATAVDEWIPALPWTIVVYLSFHVLFVVAALAAPRDAQGARELALLFQALFGVGAISLAIFALLPTEVALRASPALRAGPFATAIAWVHASDPPWNAWPSLHVSQSLLCTLALARWRAKGSAALRLALSLLWIAIALSTLTTRQHFLFDVLTGAWLGWAAWTLYLKREFGRALSAP